MAIRPGKYIPAGTLRLDETESNLPHAIWSSAELQKWSSFTPPEGPHGDSEHAGQVLPPDVQTLLLRSVVLSPTAELFRQRWINLDFSANTSLPGSGTIRVYLLPDDVDRRIILRDDGKLKRKRDILFSRLDFSRESWNGKAISSPRSEPLSYGQDDSPVDDGTTLLQMFNDIPSPDPNPDDILDHRTHEAMENLLQSDIPGLTSPLYLYQRRSAALMLQREDAPGQVLDPRLVRTVDQDGDSWYYDRHSGIVLREPRYYDGISGGILAEQMGAGKTIICLALILATRHQPALVPDLYRGGKSIVRKKIASLADMAASCVTGQSVPWRITFDAYQAQLGLEFRNCIKAIERNPGSYWLQRPGPRRARRHPQSEQTAKKMYLSRATLVVVPNNLVHQWNQEIMKHTTGLEVLTIDRSQEIPSALEMLKYDIILFSQTRFEKIAKGLVDGTAQCPLSELHLKRCIVDEGHRLGNSKISSKSSLLLGIESLQISSRWIVTGTPSDGLFGVDDQTSGENTPIPGTPQSASMTADPRTSSLDQQEKKDLERIGSMATFYLKARPWANTIEESGDTPADWAVYVMQPKHSSKSTGRKDCLRATLNSLIIRNRLSDISKLLPSVDEKTVVLDGSYQDKLSMNIFSMMIIFNSVQSQRTDLDYFFHPKQKKNLLLLVRNLKQATFFGGSFFSMEEMTKAVQTAEKFLKEKEVPVSSEDEAMLREAISFAHLAISNSLRDLSNEFHEMPVYVRDFPAGAGEAWSLDGKSGDLVCTDASLLLTLQGEVEGYLDLPESLGIQLKGRLLDIGRREVARARGIQDTEPPPVASDIRNLTLAGNTRLGDDRSPHRNSRKRRANSENAPSQASVRAASGFGRQVAEPLARTQIVSIASAKLSYLIDGIIKHQAEDQILVFYDNDNIAWYLASMLDVVCDDPTVGRQ
jgi:hypothetical protein